MKALPLRGFYAILDIAEVHGDQDAAVARAEELLAAQPCVLQLRAKRAGAAFVRDLGRRLLPLCRAAGVPFCMNDRVDLALVVGADIVHVGQDDLDIADVRQLLGTSKMSIGVSTHDLAQALAAAAAGADYLGFGPVFPTASKERPDPVVGLAGLRQVTAAVKLPVVAIGGITRARLPEVVAAGAAAAAIIADIDRAPNRAAAAREAAAAFASQPHA
jgi:thiamine-phosphate pyrophosphorylase